MKAKPKQYAQVLFDLVKDSDKKDLKKQVEKFGNVMIANNQISQFDKIISYFNEMWNQDKAIVETEIISVHELGVGVEKRIKEFVSKKTMAKEVVITSKQDKALIGGMILRYGNRLLDNSYRTKILRMKNNMIK